MRVPNIFNKWYGNTVIHLIVLDNCLFVVDICLCLRQCCFCLLCLIFQENIIVTLANKKGTFISGLIFTR